MRVMRACLQQAFLIRAVSVALTQHQTAHDSSPSAELQEVMMLFGCCTLSKWNYFCCCCCSYKGFGPYVSYLWGQMGYMFKNDSGLALMKLSLIKSKDLNWLAAEVKLSNKWGSAVMSDSVNQTLFWCRFRFCTQNWHLTSSNNSTQCQVFSIYCTNGQKVIFIVVCNPCNQNRPFLALTQVFALNYVILKLNMIYEWWFDLLITL